MTHTWHDVPDPRHEVCPAGSACEVHFPQHRWGHIREHVENPVEPWGDWLADGLTESLLNSYAPGMKEDERWAVRRAVSDRMESAARECLGVPLAVLYDVAQRPRAPAVRSAWALTADLVLRCGAKLCIREREPGRYEVCSCYFRSSVCDAPADRRWRFLARDLIHRYANGNGNGTFSPPDGSWGLRENEETGETVVNPRFRTAQRWGLTPPISEPWFNIPDHWSPPGPPPPPVSSLARRPSSH